MSASARGGRWATSGMVVEVLPEDVATKDGGDAALRMMDFQEEIERRFYLDGKTEGCEPSQNAPAQLMTDFVKGAATKSLPATSYAPGIHAARVDRRLQGFIRGRLRKGFEEFGKKQRGFLTSAATVIGCETRTSSPVRIPRDPETLRHIDIAGLYPAGEGAVQIQHDGNHVARGERDGQGQKSRCREKDWTYPVEGVSISEMEYWPGT